MRRILNKKLSSFFALALLYGLFHGIGLTPGAIASQRADLKAVFAQAAQIPPRERLEVWSEWILESPQAASRELARLPASPITEDNAPLVPAEFNCTTFVETVLALALSESESEFAKRLIRIRYRDANPSYLSRRHFPAAEWIPGNVKDGTLEDMTEELSRRAKLRLLHEAKKIARGEWIARRVAEGDAPAGLRFDAREKLDAEIPVIDARDAERALARAESGWIVDFVRKNDGRHRLLITHQGFLVRRGERWVLRHASATHGVRESEFLPYLRSLRQQDWPVVGLHFMRLKSQPKSSGPED